MKKGLVALIAGAALAGVGVAGVPLAERYVASCIKAEIGRDGRASVDRVEVGLFDRRVTLLDFRSQALGGFTAGRLEASGLSGSLGDFLRGRTPLSDFEPGAPMHAARLELVDARRSGEPGGAGWSVGSLVIEGLDLASYDAVAAGPYRFAILAARIAAALSLAHVEEKNVVYGVAAAGDTVGIRDATIDRFDRGRIGTLSLSGIEAMPKASTQAALKIENVKARDVDLSRILAQIGSASWLPGRPLSRLDVGAASATGFGGLLLSQNGVSLGAVSLETTRQSVDSSRSRLRIDDLVLRPGASLAGARLYVLLQTMGLSELKFGLDCAAVERRAKAELTIDRCALAAAELGDLSLTANFVDADEAFWRAVDAGDPAAFPQSSIALALARLVLVDKGLVDRSVRALAAATGQPPAAARGKLAHDIRSYKPADILITDDLTKLLDTVAQFVEQGGKLTIEARPNPPLGLATAAQLRPPGPDLVGLLGLSASLSH